MSVPKISHNKMGLRQTYCEGSRTESASVDSCPVAVTGVNGVEPTGSAIRELVG